MKYMGSKSKISRYIVPIIQQRLADYKLKKYVEPFVGGANVIDKVQCENKYGSDIQKYLIALWQNLDRLSEIPRVVTKEHYSEVRDCYNNNGDEFEDWYIGAVGFLASYNGRFFDGGYSGTRVTADGSVRDYYSEALKNLMTQAPLLQDVNFTCSDYRNIQGLRDFVIYCDPPYKNTKQYGASRDFDHDEFWEWCRKMSEQNIVLISEQEAPSDFQCIWEAESKRTINYAETKKTVERLFEYKE